MTNATRALSLRNGRPHRNDAKCFRTIAEYFAFLS